MLRDEGRVSERERRPIVVFTGGGSGGHVYPALSVIEEMRRDADCVDEPEIVWIGSKKGVERRIVESTSIVYRTIAVGKLRRYVSIKNLIDLFRIFAGFVQSVFILARLRPMLLFSKGGYVSVPSIIAARVLGIPVFCHDSDFDPGLATRIGSLFAERVMVGYEESREFFGESVRDKLMVSGIPIRPEIFTGDAEKGRKAFRLGGERPVLLVLGGSQGAKRVNELIESVSGELTKTWTVVHQAGNDWHDSVGAPGYVVVRYLSDEYADVLAAAEIVVCRAGATTLWELAALRKAAILLPIGSDASRGDQLRNAEYFRRNGAALVMERAPYDPAEFLQLIGSLKNDPARRKRIGDCAHELIVTDGARRIARLICSRIGEV